MAPRKCCIKSCADELKPNKEKRQFLKFPSDEEIRNSWLESIGKNLTEGRSDRKNFYICNIHFAENYFFDNELKILKDGCEVQVQCKILKLKEGSIPSNIKGDSENLRQAITIRSKKRDLSPNLSRRVDNMNHIMSLPHSEFVNKSVVNPPSECTECDNDSSSLRTEEYSNETLIKDWNTRDSAQFPNHWGMHSIGKGILFTYVGDVEHMITRSIFVKDDMTVEITAHNHIAKFPVLDKVSCLEELRIAMIKIACPNFVKDRGKDYAKMVFIFRRNFRHAINPKIVD